MEKKWQRWGISSCDSHTSNLCLDIFELKQFFLFITVWLSIWYWIQCMLLGGARIKGTCYCGRVYVVSLIDIEMKWLSLITDYGSWIHTWDTVKCGFYFSNATATAGHNYLYSVKTVPIAGVTLSLKKVKMMHSCKKCTDSVVSPLAQRQIDGVCVAFHSSTSLFIYLFFIL